MTFMFGQPTMQFDNPYFRLWQYIEEREVRHPSTDECARYLCFDVDVTRTMLNRLQREGYLFSETHREYGRGAGRRTYSTWYVRDWTSSMMSRPFPKPRNWKPPVHTTLTVAG